MQKEQKRDFSKKLSEIRFFPLDEPKSAWYNDITSFAGLLSAPVFCECSRNPREVQNNRYNGGVNK